MYEDTLLLFWLPLVVQTFYKSNVVGYLHHQERASITRSGSHFHGQLPYRLAEDGCPLEYCHRLNIVRWRADIRMKRIGWSADGGLATMRREGRRVEPH